MLLLEQNSKKQQQSKTKQNKTKPFRISTLQTSMLISRTGVDVPAHEIAKMI